MRKKETSAPAREYHHHLQDYRHGTPVGQEVKLLYGSQVGTAPPVFALVANRPEAIPASYERYLLRGFRQAWGFEGVPITLKFRRRRRQDRA